jgi:hypothetical protein
MLTYHRFKNKYNSDTIALKKWEEMDLSCNPIFLKNIIHVYDGIIKKKYKKYYMIEFRKDYIYVLRYVVF